MREYIILPIGPIIHLMIGIDQPVLQGKRGRGRAILRAGFVEDIGDVGIDGSHAQMQSFRDLAIGEARRHQTQHFNFAGGQSGWEDRILRA